MLQLRPTPKVSLRFHPQSCPPRVRTRLAGGSGKFDNVIYIDNGKDQRRVALSLEKERDKSAELLDRWRGKSEGIENGRGRALGTEQVKIADNLIGCIRTPSSSLRRRNERIPGNETYLDEWRPHGCMA